MAQGVLADPGASAQAVIWAAMGGATAAGVLGRLGLAREIAEQGRQAADANAELFAWGQAQVGYGLCLALYAGGHITEAAELADTGYRGAAAKEAAAMAGIWSAMRGIMAKAQGRPADAQAALREAVTLLEDNDTYGLRRVHLAELAARRRWPATSPSPRSARPARKRCATGPTACSTRGSS